MARVPVGQPTGRDSTCDDTKGVRLSVADDTEVINRHQY